MAFRARNGTRVKWQGREWLYVGKLPEPLGFNYKADQHVIYEDARNATGEPIYGELKIVNGCHLRKIDDV